MYRCYHSECKNNKNNGWISLYLLFCCHSVCENCVIDVAISGKGFIKCKKCSVITTLSNNIIKKARENPSGSRVVRRLNEYGLEELPLDAYYMGKGLNIGSLECLTTVETVILDTKDKSTNLFDNYCFLEQDDANLKGIVSRISELSNSLRFGLECHSECCKSLRLIADTRNGINKELNKSKEITQEFFHFLHSLLQLKEQNLLNQIGSKAKKMHNELDKVESKVKETRLKLKRTLLRVNHVYNESDKQNFEKEVNKLFDAPCIFKPVKMENEFLPEFNEGFARAIDDVSEFKNIFPSFRLTTLNEIEKCINETKTNRTRQNYNQYPALPYKLKEIVQITSLESLDEFWVSVISDKSVMMDSLIDKHCSSVFHHSLDVCQIKPGEYIFAYSDKYEKWVRGRFLYFVAEKDGHVYNKSTMPVRQNDEDCLTLASVKVELDLLDYGGTEKVDWSLLREKVDSELFNNNIYPFRARRCRLGNCIPLGDKWKNEAIKFAKQFCSDNILIMFIQDNSKEHLGVDLCHYKVKNIAVPTSSLSECLAYRGLGKISEQLNKATQDIPHYRGTSLDGEVSISVVHIENPSAFYVASKKKEEVYEKMEKNLNALYSQLPDSVYDYYCPKRRVPTIVQFEGKYKRGLVLNIEKTKVFIRMVDYGKDVIVPINCCKLIRQEFLVPPVRVIKCSLANVAPIGKSKWSQNAILRFTQLLQISSSPTTIASIKNIDSNGKAIVFLKVLVDDTFVNINASLVEDEFAENTELEKQQYISDHCNTLEFNRVNAEFQLLQKIQNVSAMEILLDHLRKNSDNILNQLIRIRFVNFYNPLCFWINLWNPEMSYFFNSFQLKVQQSSDLGIEQYKVFNKNEHCLFFYTDECYSGWRRGIVEDILMLDDPRIKPHDPNTIHYIRDRDFGGIVNVVRKDIRLCPDEIKNWGDLSLKCSMLNISPMNKKWDPLEINGIKRLIRQLKDPLIQFKEVDNFVKVEIYERKSVFSGPLEAKKFVFKSFKQMLINNNFVKLTNNTNDHIVEEETFNQNVTHNEIITTPFSYYSRDSIISILKQIYYKPNERLSHNVFNYLDPILPESTSFYGTFTEVDNEFILWFQLETANKTNLSGIIRRKINGKLKEREKMEIFSGKAEKGRALTAYDKKMKKWIRAELLCTTNDKFSVRNVDTGKVLNLFFEELSDDIFCLEINKLALNAKLSNCKPFQNFNELLKVTRHLLIGQKCKISWENFGSKNQMKISIILPDGQDLKIKLLNSDLIKEEFTDEDIPSKLASCLTLLHKSSYQLPYFAIKYDIYYPVIVTEVAMQNYVYLHFNDDNNLNEAKLNNTERNIIFTQVSEDLRKELAFFESISDCKIGDCVAAKFSMDDEWYRGIVRNVVEPQRLYDIFFVDYGNSEIVNIRFLKKLPSKFISFPPIHAFLAKISNIRPQDGIWHKNVSDAIKRTLEAENKSFLALFKNKTLPYEIELYEASQSNLTEPKSNAFQNLISLGYLDVINSQID